jgi:hypothetical protein
VAAFVTLLVESAGSVHVVPGRGYRLDTAAAAAAADGTNSKLRIKGDVVT